MRGNRVKQRLTLQFLKKFARGSRRRRAPLRVENSAATSFCPSVRTRWANPDITHVLRTMRSLNMFFELNHQLGYFGAVRSRELIITCSKLWYRVKVIALKLSAGYTLIE